MGEEEDKNTLNRFMKLVSGLGFQKAQDSALFTKNI